MSSLISYDGTRIAYEVIGSGPPLLLVPGGPRASRYLEDLGGLAEDFSLVRFDARGTGASDRSAGPTGYAFPRLALDLDAVRAHLGLDRVPLLAHSAGVAVAQAFAVEHPERVERLVLVAPGPQVYGAGGEDVGRILGARAGEPWHAQAVTAFEELFALGPETSAEEVLATLERLTPAVYGAWGERQRAHAADQRAGFGLEAWAGFFGTDEGPAIIARLPRIAAPVLVVTGERDALAGVSVGEVVAALYPDAHHATIPGAGHYPWVDAPSAFAAAVRGFLHGSPAGRHADGART